MPSWGRMSCLQRTARVVMVLAILSVTCCIIFNCIAIYRASTETWFCKCGSGDCKKKCCADCNLKDEIFFYVLRGYTLAFCLVAIAAEFKTEFFEEYVKMCHFFFPRGFWQIFIGLMTVEANTVPGDPGAEQWADIIGLVLVGVGLVHLILGCACFNEYSKDKREKEMTDLNTASNAGPSQI